LKNQCPRPKIKIKIRKFHKICERKIAQAI